MGNGALHFPQAPAIMQTGSANHVIVFYGRRCITSLGCQRGYPGEQHIIAARTGFNCWRDFLIVCLTALTGTVVSTVSAKCNM